MVTRDDILRHMEQKTYRPLDYGELKQALNVPDEQDRHFRRLLTAMEKDGDIVLTRRGQYGLPRLMNLVRGVITMNPRGFGILRPDDPTLPEIFVYGRDLNGAMHHDRVLVRVNRQAYGTQRAEGEVVRAVTRAHTQVVGTYKKVKPLPQVIPDDPRLLYPIYVRIPTRLKLNDGDKVVVQLTVWPDKDRYPEGKITEVLGAKGAPGVDVVSIIKKFQLRDSFPPEVLEEAEAVARPVGEEEAATRLDLRHLPTVTIDGEDAKDLDDAVSISRLPDGSFELGVHIADVAHYVAEDSALDREALRRATSVYLVDRVLPMLPPVLSNGICSLNAGEDRLAMSVLMRIGDDGEVQDYRIARSVIRVDERMTYTAVNDILLDNDARLRERYHRQLEDFAAMRDLCGVLRGRRITRGALDFDFPEAKVVLDPASGLPLEIKRYERRIAEMIIEEFMIKANEVVAEHIHRREAPSLYRVHERPDPDSIEELNRVLGVFGHRIRGERVEPLAFQRILTAIRGRPEERTISMLLLRSMKHARYAPHALGHFGLASPFYTHFTSPIRRYPDLVVHRVLAHLLRRGSVPARKRAVWEKKMTHYGEHSTLREVIAEEAERESVDMKKAQYMLRFVGEVFPAIVVSVLSFGFFVALENTVEGLVHVSSLNDDYYEYDDRMLTLVGRHTGKAYRIGDRVTVRLVKVNVDEAKIDFELEGLGGR
ncbi:MAG: ribonuclease R [Syntrophomonadaceae bacterium]|jgi:ribonuclease R|nr:ribonuclease R [Syntrophomonadaceae bacterium]MDH7496985.1 ribonuclease R [Syntrophomonadaceae bacterium]